MVNFGVSIDDSRFYIPPYEWYNNEIANWTAELDLTLVNITYGTLSHADYTTPEMPNYRSSDVIYESIISYEEQNNLNGFILLVHIGAGEKREDKFYLRLNGLLDNLKSKGYTFLTIDELLK